MRVSNRTNIMLRILAIRSFQKKQLHCRGIMGLNDLKYRRPPQNAKKAIHPTSDCYKELLAILHIRISQLEDIHKCRKLLPHELAESEEVDITKLQA